MKKNITISLHFLTVALLIAVPTCIQARIPKEVDTGTQPTAPQHIPEAPKQPTGLDYATASALMKDFLDLKVKPQKPIKYWVKQIIGIIKQQRKSRIQKLGPFISEFYNAVKTRNSIGIGWAFKNHKEKFGEPALTKEIETRLKQKNGLQLLNNILKARLKK